MKNYYFTILFSLIFLIYGCSKEDDKKTNFVRTPDNTVLEGTWKTSCITSGAYSIIMSIEITGSTGVYKQEWHGGSGCSTDVWTTVDTYTSYTVGNKIDKKIINYIEASGKVMMTHPGGEEGEYAGDYSDFYEVTIILTD